MKKWFDKTFYSSYGDNWDNALFRREILTHLSRDAVVMDLGAGAGIVPQMNFRGMAKRVCGVDPDERVTNNPYLDEAKIGFGNAIPYPDDHFDLVFSANVLEHLEHPVEVFREVRRILKPGGLFLLKTPNRRHYVALIARMTPHSFHAFVNRIRGREEVDTFPTLYRANTPGSIKRFAGKAGFTINNMQMCEGRPEYLRFSAITYMVGLAYERLVNTSNAFSVFRVVIMAQLQKI